MSGQPTPPRIVEAFALNAPACSPAAPIAGGKTSPFPATSQVSIVDGAASLVDGFVPLNMTDPTSGGIPPFGVDMNGILYLISAWAAFLAAGQVPVYDATLQTAMGGYALGARLRQAANSNAYWISTVNGNMTDPDTGGAGWASSVPVYVTSAPTAGTHTDNVLSGPANLIWDIDTSAGNVTLNGFVAQRDGQQLVITNTGANALAIGVAAGTAANQVRANAGPIGILQNDSLTIQYCTALTKWVIV